MQSHLKKLNERHVDILNDLHRTLSGLGFHCTPSFVDVRNAKSVKRAEFKENQKFEKLKHEYLATGMDPKNVVSIFPAIPVTKWGKGLI